MSSFSLGDCVMYNSKCCTVFKLPGFRNLTKQTVTGYLLKENNSNVNYDNIPESSISLCSNVSLCNHYWNDFVYNGDNKLASSWILQNIVRHLKDSNNLEWGHNETNTQYYLTIGSTTLTKNKTTESN